MDSPANHKTFQVIGKSLDADAVDDLNEIALLATTVLLKEKSLYISRDGTFKYGVEGCVKHFMEVMHLPEENAWKLCAYIGRKASKISKIMDVLNLEKEEKVNKVLKNQKKHLKKVRMC